MSQLSWSHHTVVQALLSRGPLKESDIHSIFREITGKDPIGHQQIFNDFIRNINKELDYVKFEMRGCRNQYDGKVYYGVVNTLADEQSKLGTKYSVPQIAYYKTVIEAITHDTRAQGSITNIEAINLRLDNQVHTSGNAGESQSQVPAAFKSFTISQKEKTLNDLIQDKWLCLTSEGKIGLGVRSFLDLRSWFHANEIPACNVCNETGVKASTCPNVDCSIRIHDYCLKKKFSQRKVAKVCPGCSTAWNLSESQEEEEDAVDADEEPRQSNGNGERLKRVKGEAVNIDLNEAPSNPVAAVRRKLKACKTEAVDAVAGTSKAVRRSKRSRQA